MANSNKVESHVEVIVNDRNKSDIKMPILPKPLTLLEKKYLVAVERGDLPQVRRMLQSAHWNKDMDVNCVDPLGRGSISLAIDGENLEMLELLVVMGVETKEALLQAISVEFVEAVELLLEYEEIIHEEGEPYSWEKVHWNTRIFPPDTTPIMLAAHRNNYEIIKILLDRGATLPMPHDLKCGCETCIKNSTEDSLRFSLARVNEYRALASPSLIALSSNDPILTAFQLSWELRNLALAEQESKTDYMELRNQCMQFAVDLLKQARSSQELAIILNHDLNSPPYEEGEHMKLARLKLAIQMKQKKFVAHPNIQQLLAALWYEGLPGFRRKKLLKQCLETAKVVILFPFYCFVFWMAPRTKAGKLLKKPFIKFLIHASSYLFFLLLLILVSQNADRLIIKFIGTESMRKELEKQEARQRGNPPSAMEWLVLAYIVGFIWEEIIEISREKLHEYLKNIWKIVDFIRNSLYAAAFFLRIIAYVQQRLEINQNPSLAFVPREEWYDYDPQLISEGFFAAGNVFSGLKLIQIFSVNPYLGPLQISVSRMMIDIIKFFFIYSLVLFSFACGLNQLLGYFAELERQKCYNSPDGLPDWEGNPDSCIKWRRFGNLFESSQSLFWASFGMIGIENFDLAGIKSYTRFWSLLMFGSYSVINIIVLLNLLIAMMSNSYAIIEEHSDTEWKFARTKLWMSFFDKRSTLPSPFNIFPSPALLLNLFKIRRTLKMIQTPSMAKQQEKERDGRYTAVMRALVWRYVSDQHRQAEEGPVTEDHINEVKADINAAKFDLLEVFSRNGMIVPSARAHSKDAALGKKMKVWERRLMRNFHVAPVASEEELDEVLKIPPEEKDPLSRFRQIARLAVLKSNQSKWRNVVQGICEISQIGRSTTKEALKSQLSLQRAMAEAKKFISEAPIPELEEDRSHRSYLTPIKTPKIIGGTLNQIIHEEQENRRVIKSESPRLISAPTLSKGEFSASTITPIVMLESVSEGESDSEFPGSEASLNSSTKKKSVEFERQPKYGWL